MKNQDNKKKTLKNKMKSSLLKIFLLYKKGIEEMEYLENPVYTEWKFKFVGNKFMVTGNFEPFETNIVRKLLSKSDVFINIGANVGYYCCHALSLGKPVIAFEPIVRNLRFLYKNIQINGWENVEIYPIALSNKIGVIDIYGSNTSSSIINGWANNSEFNKTLVPVSTLDLVLHNRIKGKRALILVDIEGAEKKMLDSASKILNNNPKPIWIIEIVTKQHQPIGIEFNPNFSEIFRSFFRKGYKAIYADDNLLPVTIEEVEKIERDKKELNTYNFLFYDDNNFEIIKDLYDK